MLKKEFRSVTAFAVAALCAALMSAGCSKPSSQKISVAVAANFIKPFTEIAAVYEKKTGVKIEATFNSTGNLYSQITSGAPYDMFLAADEARPAKLLEKDLAETPFVYAKGRIVFWSLKKEYCSVKSWRDAVKIKGIKKIAIANPETAPYGTAALKAIQAAGLESFLKPVLVTAQTIAQAFQYASTGAADAGFCALSSAYSEDGKKGCYLAVEEGPEIIQSACILKRTADRKAVADFVEFLMSGEAAKIKTKYGYR